MFGRKPRFNGWGSPLPHRAVVRDTSTSTKLRIVHDASSKPDKLLPSLNECLLKGPSLNPLIVDIIVKI